MFNFIKNIFSNRVIQNTSDTGLRGEDEAVKFLKKEGHKIVDRNYSCKAGEIDVVIKDSSMLEDVLVFVEVKTRSSTSHGRASEFVDSRKQTRIIKTANSYLLKYYGDDLNKFPNIRFDIVEVYLKDGRFDCELIKDAFHADW